MSNLRPEERVTPRGRDDPVDVTDDNPRRCVPDSAPSVSDFSFDSLPNESSSVRLKGPGPGGTDQGSSAQGRRKEKTKKKEGGGGKGQTRGKGRAEAGWASGLL